MYGGAYDISASFLGLSKPFYKQGRGAAARSGSTYEWCTRLTHRRNGYRVRISFLGKNCPHKMADFERHFCSPKSPLGRNLVRSKDHCTQSHFNMMAFEGHIQQTVKTSFVTECVFYIFYFYGLP